MKAACRVLLIVLIFGGLFVWVTTPTRSPNPLPGRSFAAPATSSVWWVGASSTDSSALPNTGVQGVIQVISTPVSASNTLAFWVSDDLSNNYWGQVGYYISDSSVPLAFYQIWNLANTSIISGGYTSVSTGNHTFSMYLQSGTTWAYALDGKVFGTFNMGVSSSSASYPVYALSEEDASSVFSFPTVTFSTAMQVLRSGTWSNVQTAESYGTAWGVEGLSQNAGLPYNQIMVGGSLATLPAGTVLWSSGSISATRSLSTSNTTSTSSSVTLPPVTTTVTTTSTETQTLPSTQTVTQTTTMESTSTSTQTVTTTATSTLPATTTTATDTVTSTSTLTQPVTTTFTQTQSTSSITTTTTNTITSTATQTVSNVSTVYSTLTSTTVSTSFVTVSPDPTTTTASRAETSAMTQPVITSTAAIQSTTNSVSDSAGFLSATTTHASASLLNFSEAASTEDTATCAPGSPGCQGGDVLPILLLPLSAGLAVIASGIGIGVILVATRKVLLARQQRWKKRLISKRQYSKT